MLSVRRIRVKTYTLEGPQRNVNLQNHMIPEYQTVRVKQWQQRTNVNRQANGNTMQGREKTWFSHNNFRCTSPKIWRSVQAPITLLENWIVCLWQPHENQLAILRWNIMHIIISRSMLVPQPHMWALHIIVGPTPLFGCESWNCTTNFSHTETLMLG